MGAKLHYLKKINNTNQQLFLFLLPFFKYQIVVQHDYRSSKEVLWYSFIIFYFKAIFIPNDSPYIWLSSQIIQFKFQSPLLLYIASSKSQLIRSGFENLIL